MLACPILPALGRVPALRTGPHPDSRLRHAYVEIVEDETRSDEASQPRGGVRSATKL
jgi:hypothetical protein